MEQLVLGMFSDGAESCGRDRTVGVQDIITATLDTMRKHARQRFVFTQGMRVLAQLLDKTNSSCASTMTARGCVQQICEVGAADSAVALTLR